MSVSMECLLRRNLSVVLFLLLLFLAFFPTRVRADNLLQGEEIQSMINALRVSGYHLFANALLTADILSLLSSAGGSYTFFAPPDAALYDLDLASKSSQEYLDAVKYHIVITKLSYYNLNGLPNAARLDTLLQNRSLTLTTFGLRGMDYAPVMVNNAAVAFPDLYYDYHVAAHGLATVLKPIVVDVSSTAAFSEASDIPISASAEAVQGELRDLYVESNPMAVLSYPLQTRPVSPEEVEEIWKEITEPVVLAPPSPCDEVAANGCNFPEAIGSMKEVMRSTTSNSPVLQMDSYQTLSVGGRRSSAESFRHPRHPHHQHQHHLRHHHGKHSHAHSFRHFQESEHTKKSSVDFPDNDSTS